MSKKQTRKFKPFMVTANFSNGNKEKVWVKDYTGK
jgi:hypothetical protein